MKKLMKLVLGAWCFALGASVAQAEKVTFRDYDAAIESFTNAVRECTLVTGETRILENGWYAVKGSVTIPEGANLTVSGDAHLILCDGAKLTIEKPADFSAAIAVGKSDCLTIYGAANGTGCLVATGGIWSAGIGADNRHSCGTVTINGGMVTATGERQSAGIGGSSGNPAGGTVKINGGAIKAQGGSDASDIGPGFNSTQGEIYISGGIFGNRPKDEWLSENHVVIDNPDPTTVENYPYKVRGPVCTVTIGALSHMTAAWTSGDGSETNAVSGTAFKVRADVENVKVIFTPELAYDLVGDAVVNLGTIAADVVFGEQSGYKVPNAVPNGAIIFRDYDATTGTFTNAARKCTLVTGATRTLENGWYAVQGTVWIPDGANLTVNGTAHLVLCDGAKLRVENPGVAKAAVKTTGATLVIYAQAAGTGALVAVGGTDAAGIGGDENNAGGTVTINGGTVTATGSSGGAGIGGGDDGAGGTVTINGGTVTAWGGTDGTGIGDAHGGTGGTVTIKGGAINADGMRGDIRIRGGIFKNEPQAEWVISHYKVFENSDEATKGEYPFAVMGIEFPYLDWDPALKKMTNAVVRADDWIEVTESMRTLENGKWYVVNGVVTIPAGANLSVNGTAHLILCDGASLTILNPGDYRNAVYVSKTASLVIYGQTAGTGALTVTGGNFSSGIGGGSSSAPNFVYDCGTVTVNGGTVTAQGGDRGAGIGGGYFGAGGTVMINGGTVKASGGTCAAGIGGGSCGTDGGTVTVNGGTVTAQGGSWGAGIGGGEAGSGGTVTVNGGTVTANGGSMGAGIGGGFGGNIGGAGGTVKINGGAIKAQGGSYGAGIGGGYHGFGGTVTISGGSVTAVGEGQGGDIGPGGYGSGGTVTISGGIFARPLRDEWAVEGYAVGGNPDSATSADYPYTVIPAAFTVTIGDHPHLIVQRTYSNGSVTSLVTGTSFRLGAEQRGVCVIFTPEYAYRFVEESETGVRPLPSPVIEDCGVEVPAVEEILSEVTFAVGAGLRRAAYVRGDVTNELVTGETVAVVQLGTRIDLIVEELPRHYPFAGERTFTVEQETMRVVIFASPIPKGMEGNPFQIGADVFAVTNAEGVLTITGTGAMSDFAFVSDVPWEPATVTKVTVGASVTQIGANAWSGMGDSVVINGTALSAVRYLAPGIGYVQPVGAISGAEFERVEIVDGKAYLGVSVYTNSEVKVIGEVEGGGVGGGWGVATNGVIEVPAPGKQGFFYLLSKPATSDALPVFDPEIK